VTQFPRTFCFILLACLAGFAQSLPSDVTRKIEHLMRMSYKIPPDAEITVGAIAPSTEMPGFDTVSVNVDSGSQRKDYTFLLSKDRNTMVRLNRFDLTHDAFVDEMSKINVKGRPVRGAKAAKVVVVGFDDFECPFCARSHQTLFPDLLKEYGDRVAFIYKDDPVEEIHPWALHAAVDANCLAAQNSDAYWDFADNIHANRQQVEAEKVVAGRLEVIDKFAFQQGQEHNLDAARLQSCISAQDETPVRASMREAKALGITGTPAIFVNGQRIEGAAPANILRAAIERALRESAGTASLPASASIDPSKKNEGKN